MCIMYSGVFWLQDTLLAFLILFLGAGWGGRGVLEQLLIACVHFVTYSLSLSLRAVSDKFQDFAQKKKLKHAGDPDVSYHRSTHCWCIKLPTVDINVCRFPSRTWPDTFAEFPNTRRS